MNSIWEMVFCPQHGLLRLLDINMILPCLNHLLVEMTFLLTNVRERVKVFF